MKQVRIHWLDGAWDSYVETLTWIADRSPQGAMTVRRSVEEALDILAINPRLYPVSLRRTDSRMMVVGKYLLFYKVSDGRVDIVDFVHGARDDP